MPSALQYSSRFPAVAAARRAAVARQVIAAERPSKAKVAERCHESVVLPWYMAVASGKSFEVKEMPLGKGTAIFVDVGEDYLPMLSWQEFGQRLIRLSGPVPKSRVHGLRWPYDADEVFNTFRPNVRLATYEGDDGVEVSFAAGKASAHSYSKEYGRALWDAVHTLLWSQRAPENAQTTSAEQELGAVVKTLTAGRISRELAAPPIAHNLLGLVSWKGVPVAVTSTDGKSPVGVWLMKNDGTWLRIEVPDLAWVPHRSCTVALSGDTLRLFGGVDKSGAVCPTHMAYPLQDGARSGFPASLWQREDDLPSRVAWPAAAVPGAVPHVFGGAYVTRVDAHKEDGSVETRQELGDLQAGAAHGRAGWKVRAAAPHAITGASTVQNGQCIVFGPGAELNGRVLMYDLAEGGAWYQLPSLPDGLGLGQVMLNGSELLYLGGFRGDGAASKDIYRLDLAAESPDWKRVGKSDFVQGSARVVNAYGKPLALLMTPDAARAYELERVG